MGLSGHMRIHDSGIHRNAKYTDRQCTLPLPATLTTTATPTTMKHIFPASTDLSCPHCARNFNSRIGLVGHLRIHRTEAGEPVPGAPTDLVGHLRIHRTEAGEPVPRAPTYRAHLHCPQCSRSFAHRKGLLVHMRLHDNVRALRLMPHRDVEGVGQQETVLRTCFQKKEAVIFAATETIGTKLSMPGSVVHPDASVKVTKDLSAFGTVASRACRSS
ncbi:unnamed protein product [Schistocephalus solidus]|uniref:C2H2-type domain-containing protein n=1 Tax=Schistocephalus solidus TaxID=70667 RepID=A0A183SPD8_SCHSO|nr:unnamed protein product [Schistocephalus solidus]